MAKNSIELSRKWLNGPNTLLLLTDIPFYYTIFRTNNYNYIILFLYSIYRSTDRMLMVFRASCNNIRWTTRSIRWQRQYHQPYLYDTIWTRATWLHILVSWPQGKHSIFLYYIYNLWVGYSSSIVIHSHFVIHLFGLTYIQHIQHNQHTQR